MYWPQSGIAYDDKIGFALRSDSTDGSTVVNIAGLRASEAGQAVSVSGEELLAGLRDAVFGERGGRG